jgi:glycosyltransferase involved in cell wall biosynthesis
MPSMTPRKAVADFYQSDYLRPVVASPAIRRFTVAKLQSRPSVAVVPERVTYGYPTPSAYIRQLQPLHHPGIARDFDVVVTDAASVFDYHADVIATQRCAIPDIATADALARHARKSGATLLFDLDDDLLDVPRSHPDAMRLRPAAEVVRRMLDHADIVWVGTTGLAERLAPIRPDAVVIENRLDERIWTHAAPPSSFQQEPVRILCMGTAALTDDFALVAPALVRLKREYGNRVVIDILGMTSQSALPAGLAQIVPSVHAAQSYPGFVHWLNAVQPRWHIGLAPLLDTSFNSCKSAIKAMDYAAMGLFVLASDTPVYRGSIADGPAGHLVPNTTAEWYAALNWLMRNENFRHTTAARSRSAFLADGTLAGQAQTRRAAWTQLLRIKPDEIVPQSVAAQHSGASGRYA